MAQISQLAEHALFNAQRFNATRFNQSSGPVYASYFYALDGMGNTQMISASVSIFSRSPVDFKIAWISIDR